MSMRTMLTSNSYHSKYVWFLSLLILIHNFRKILIILINGSSDSHRQKRQRRSRANIQPSSEYFSIRKRFILILWFVYMLSYEELKSITSYVLWRMNVSEIMSMTRFFFFLNTHYWHLIRVYMLSYEESKSTTSYVLLNKNMMSTSNFEYKSRGSRY